MDEWSTKMGINTMQSIQYLNQKAPDMSPLTIRDLFAMSAITLFAGGSWNGTPDSYADKSFDGVPVVKDLARKAYKLADAMMEARKC